MMCLYSYSHVGFLFFSVGRLLRLLLELKYMLFEGRMWLLHHPFFALGHCLSLSHTPMVLIKIGVGGGDLTAL